MLNCTLPLVRECWRRFAGGLRPLLCLLSLRPRLFLSLTLTLFLSLLPCLVATGFAGSIVHEETVQERQPTPVRPFYSSNRAPLPPPDPRPQENLIDGMDVYALSPHAAALALPRMVTPQLAVMLQQGRMTLPPPAQWEAIIRRAAARHDLPEALISAVIRTESNFQVDAVSHKGAQGLMQLMPETQRYLGVSDPYDPEANVQAGCAYLREQLSRFGSLELALAAYNAGPGNVAKYGGIPPFAETQGFIEKVLRYSRGTP